MMRVVDPALILVVEDEEALRHDIVEELQEAGYRTLAAKGGKEALDLLERASPDLLLCDITMPDIDGYDVLRAVREHRPELAAMPFVFLTALSEPREIIDGKLLGADDYLVKPVDYDLMLATVAARLRQVDSIKNRHDGEILTLRRAVSGLAVLSGDGAKEALDLIALGVVLLDGQGKPLHINRAAQEIADAADFIRAGQSGIRTSDPLTDRALRDGIAAMLVAAKRGEAKVVGVMLHRSCDARTMSALISSLPRAATGTTDQPHAAVFLSARDQRKHVPETLLIDLFGLTPTEARVAGALARSARAADVAVALGVSQTTISFHMRNLFLKTGTNRQADLIALILAGPMMIQSE